MSGFFLWLVVLTIGLTNGLSNFPSYDGVMVGQALLLHPKPNAGGEPLSCAVHCVNTISCDGFQITSSSSSVAGKETCWLFQHPRSIENNPNATLYIKPGKHINDLLIK